MATWEQAGKARNDLADLVEGLTPEQVEMQTLCSEWNAHGVLAHVTAFAETGFFSLFGSMAKAGFNIDKLNKAGADKGLERSVADLAASLREVATQSAPIPGFPEAMTVSDIAIHTQDVRRPLGLGADIDDAVQSTTLDFLTTKMAMKMINRRPLEGLHLVATDRDWSFGEGDEISGTSEALMMALAHRPVLDELGGNGLAKWQD